MIKNIRAALKATAIKNFIRRNIKLFLGMIGILLILLFVLLLVYKVIDIHLTQNEIDGAGKLIIFILQLVGLTAVGLFIALIIRLMARKCSGTVILPFDVPGGSEQYSGKAIVERLLAECHRLMYIGEYNEEQEIAQKEISSVTNEPEKQNKQAENISGKIRSESGTAMTTKVDVELAEFQNLSPDISQTITNITISVGGTSFSLGQVLLDIRRLWNYVEPESTISGSLQKNGTSLTLIVKRETKKKLRKKIWQSEGEDLMVIVKDIAFKIVYDLQQTVDGEEPFKSYIAANQAYAKLDRLNDLAATDIEELKRIAQQTLDSLRTYKAIKDPPKLLEKIFFALYNAGEYESAASIAKCIIDFCDRILDSGRKLIPQVIAQISNYYGLCCHLTQKYPEAIWGYRKAIEMDPGNYVFPYNLTILYNQFKDSPGFKLILDRNSIQEIIEKAIKDKLVDQNTPASIFSGDWYNDLGLIEEAKKAYTAACKQFPDSVALKFKLGTLYENIEERENAIRTLQEALTLAETTSDPEFSNLCHALAYNYSLLKTEEGTNHAIELYKKAILANPLAAFVYQNLGIIYEELLQFDEALDFYSAALSLDPDSGKFALLLSELYNRVDENNSAIEVLRPLVDKNKNDSGLINHLGYFYSDSGQLDLAVDTFNKAIALNGKDTYAHNGLGYVYVGKNLIKEALNEFQISVDIDKENRYSHAAIAACLKKLGQNAEYETAKINALALAPGQEENEYNQANFEALCSRNEEALKLLAQALAKRQHTPAFASRDRDFDLIRDDPRFEKLVTAVY
jgi:tetratricopeptide (TPR) repeat protein